MYSIRFTRGDEMTSKSNLDSPQDQLQAVQSSLRCEPLLTRIDPLLRASASQPTNAHTIQAANGLDGFTLAQPLFTRLTADVGLSQNSQRLLLSELRSFGIAWLGNVVEPNDRKRKEGGEWEFSDLHRISPLQIDDPIEVQSFQNAAAIELQMVGLPFHKLANSRRARWTPNLPIDISKFEQLGKRIEAMRVVSGGKCPIGAAVCPGAVYDDLRFLIDSGFDFITLLVDVQYEMSQSCSLRLAPLEPSLEQSIKAVQDSGSKTKILVSANLSDGVQMFRCLQMGATAISIDAFIANSKPTEVVPVKDTFGSVLRAYVPPAAVTGSLAWIKPAMTQLVEDLRDCAIYAGL